MTISTLSRVRGNLLVLALVVAATAPLAWADTNVALNAPVTLYSTGTGGNWNNSTSGNLAIITNGTLLPYGTGYSSSAATSQAVEWSSPDSTGWSFDISLGADDTIDSITLDADDNDEYVLDYWDQSTSSWQPLWDRSILSQGVGLRVDSTTLSTPVVTDAVLFYGGGSNDGNPGGYAVSQVELFGTPAGNSETPEPGTLLLVGSGLVAMGRRIRRRRSA